MQAKYADKIHSIIDVALNGGIRRVPLRQNSPTPFIDDRHRRKFFTACHRSFEKAQNEMILLIQEMRENPEKDEAEKIELVIRKIADAIAFMMFQTHTHLMRRLSIHTTAPAIDIETLKRAQLEANKLNHVNRQSFALLADLTTFIHIADILRLDVRSPAKISLIELKSGKVNEILLSALETYKPDPSSLERIASDPAIQEHHRGQAKRIVKQRIRVQRFEDIIQNEEGIDPSLGVPIKLSGPMIQNRPFDSVLDELCDSAKKSGYGGATVDGCLHIGAGYDPDLTHSKKRAFDSINHVLNAALQDRPEGFEAIQKEVVEAVGIDRDDNYKIIDLFANNLHSMATRPFLFWQIKRQHLNDLISGKLRLIAVFDLQKFVWLARREGANVKFASRSETEKAKVKLQTINVMTFGHRAITYPYGEMEAYFSTGLFGRIINELMRPLQLIREMMIPDADEIKEFTAWAKRSGTGDI